MWICQLKRELKLLNLINIFNKHWKLQTNKFDIVGQDKLSNCLINYNFGFG